MENALRRESATGEKRIQETRSDIIQRRNKETDGLLSTPENVITFSARNGNIKDTKKVKLYMEDWSAGTPALRTCLTKPPESFGLKSNFIKSCSVQSKRVIDAKMSYSWRNALPKRDRNRKHDPKWRLDSADKVYKNFQKILEAKMKARVKLDDDIINTQRHESFTTKNKDCVKGKEKRTGDKNNPMLFSNVKSIDGENISPSHLQAAAAVTVAIDNHPVTGTYVLSNRLQRGRPTLISRKQLCTLNSPLLPLALAASIWKRESAMTLGFGQLTYSKEHSTRVFLGSHLFETEDGDTKMQREECASASPQTQEEEGFVWTQKRLQTTPDPQCKVAQIPYDKPPNHKPHHLFSPVGDVLLTGDVHA
ncbi:hypothetical protein MG293_017360 [Ovis ammon polii]|uniref:Uncharacterized protein n=1 Tax=Ovis ammon polii TaxID=230172 RepID=A0AAD4TTJ4_OVIAM|nr:hypothetical protein MG293_017360 [Ovis ammon polii]